MKKGFFRKGIALTIIMMFMAVGTVQGINKDYVYIKSLSKCNAFCGIPEEEWNKTFGGETHDNSYSVLQTSDGGYIIVGYTETFGEGLGDVWLIKTDMDGNEEWNQTFNGIGGSDFGTDIIQTSDGGYIITGLISNMAGPPLDFILDAWLIKTDGNGNEQWNRTFGGSAFENFYSVQQTNDGGYILIGYTRSFGAGKDDMWLLKTDDKGYEQWNKTFGESYNEYGKSIQVASDGGYILIGSKQSITDPYYMDIWLLKTDENGNMQWNKTFDGSNNDKGYSLQETNDNGFILVGYTGGSFESDYDLWLIKTNANGVEQWNQTFGGLNDDSGESVKETKDGGYIITGYTESFGAGDLDVWLIKTDENGIKSWGKTFGGTGYDKARSVLQTSDEGFIITGCTDSYGAGFDDVWLIKVEPEYINHPPSPPIIKGTTTGIIGAEYEYTFNSTDSDCDEIIYLVDWGDDSPFEYIGPSPPGVEAAASHTWSKKGTYHIKAKAQDIHGAESKWGKLTVVMPRNKLLPNTLFLRLLEIFPNAFPVLRYILRL